MRRALKINHVLKAIVNPGLKTQYPSNDYEVKHVIGIDTSEIRAARIGVRGGNDLVWVGRAANYAAKLANLDFDRATWITEVVFSKLHDLAKYSGSDSKLMWEKYNWNQMGGQTIYGSNWTWRI